MLGGGSGIGMVGGASRSGGGSECRNYSSSSHTVAAHYVKAWWGQHEDRQRSWEGSGWVVVLVGGGGTSGDGEAEGQI